jgi:hypothetical protein
MDPNLQLERLYLDSDQVLGKWVINDQEVISLANALSSNKKLKELYLGGFDLRCPAYKALFDMLEVNHTLETLYLGRSDIEGGIDENVDDLCAILKNKECSLKVLKLHSKIETKHLPKILEALKENTSLEDFDLTYSYPNPGYPSPSPDDEPIPSPSFYTASTAILERNKAFHQKAKATSVPTNKDPSAASIPPVKVSAMSFLNNPLLNKKDKLVMEETSSNICAA